MQVPLTSSRPKKMQSLQKRQQCTSMLQAMRILLFISQKLSCVQEKTKRGTLRPIGTLRRWIWQISNSSLCSTNIWLWIKRYFYQKSLQFPWNPVPHWKFIENSMTLFLISCTNIPKTVILKMIQRENLVWTRKRAIALFNLEKPHFERNVWVKSDAKPKGTLAVPKRFAGTSKESSCQSNCSNKLSAQIFRI